MLKIYRDLDIPSKHHARLISLDIRHTLLEANRIPVIIFIHGFKSFKDWGAYNIMADRWAREGFCVVKVNLSHNGTSPEYPTEFVDLQAFSKNTLTTEIDDIKEVVRSIKHGGLLKRCCGIEQDLSIHLVGHSRGGAASLMAASEIEEEVDSVITWAAISCFESEWKPEELKYWKMKGEIKIWHEGAQQDLPMKYAIVTDYLENRSRCELKSLASYTKKPVLIIHAKDDQRISVTNAHQIKKLFSQSEIFLLEEGGHLFEIVHPWEGDHLSQPFAQVIEKTTEFLKEQEIV